MKTPQFVTIAMGFLHNLTCANWRFCQKAVIFAAVLRVQLRWNSICASGRNDTSQGGEFCVFISRSSGTMLSAPHRSIAAKDQGYNEINSTLKAVTVHRSRKFRKLILREIREVKIDSSNIDIIPHRKVKVNIRFSSDDRICRTNFV